MASAAKFGKASRESLFGNLVDQHLRASGPVSEDLSAIRDLDFLESPMGLNMTLFPVQRVIFKCLFGIPIDYKEGMVPVWDVMHEKLLHTFTESDYLKWKFDQGLGNVCDWRDIPAHGFNTMALLAGRRSGKSQLVAACGATLLRRLLLLRDPQGIYGLESGSFIDFTMIGTDEESATRLYDKLRAVVGKASFFHPFLKGNTETEMTFVTEVDRDRPGSVPSIKAAAWPCTTNSVRGPSSYFLALDEFAFFRSTKHSNSEDLYKAATPSTSFFKNPQDPSRRDSRILLISSPDKRLGKMYDLHQLALKEGISSNIFTLNCYTAEMNPQLPASALRDEHKQNEADFPVEFGGKFRDGSGSFVPVTKVEQCIDKGRSNTVRFTPEAVGRKYFWTLDLGLAKDATGLAIGHLDVTEGKGIELIIDYVDRMMVGEQFTGPGLPSTATISGPAFASVTELQVSEIMSWLIWMEQVFPCYKGLTDQGGGRQLIQTLQVNGLNKIELVHITPQLNSQMYFALRGFVYNASIRFPEEEKFLREFKQLEADWVNKHQLRVEAPQEKGAHDDMSDAVAGVAFLAQKWIEEEGQLDLDPSGKSITAQRALVESQPIVDPSAFTARDLRTSARLIQTRMDQMVHPNALVMGNPRNPFGRR